jgi:hypothetical protein
MTQGKIGINEENEEWNCDGPGQKRWRGRIPWFAASIPAILAPVAKFNPVRLLILCSAIPFFERLANEQ